MFITSELDFFGRRRIFIICLVLLAGCERETEADEAARAASENERRGELLSLACQACHSLDESGSHQVGPNLFGMFDRIAGTNDGFDYSAALRDSGFAWTPALLDAWLSDPAGFLPGTTMAFTGYQQPGDRAALIEFLVAATAPAPARAAD